MEGSNYNKLLNELSERLASELGNRLKKIILFGSYARGDQDGNSDIDCVAVVDMVDKSITDVLDETAAEMLIKHGAVFSIIPIDENRYIQQQYNPLLINVAREGVLLWPTRA